jgi:hypothetical protein
LTKKLKYVSSYLTRILDKQYLEKQRNEGKSKGARKGLTQPKDSKVHQTLLVDAQIENSKRKQAHYKQKLHETMSEFKKLTDPDILDKIRSEIEYLDEMIRGEQTNVIAYECKNKQFQRIDNFGMAEKREKRLVAIENEIIRLKMKIMRR